MLFRCASWTCVIYDRFHKLRINEASHHTLPDFDAQMHPPTHSFTHLVAHAMISRSVPGRRRAQRQPYSLYGLTVVLLGAMREAGKATGSCNRLDGKLQSL
jgi:hypothetical protein